MARLIIVAFMALVTTACLASPSDRPDPQKELAEDFKEMQWLVGATREHVFSVSKRAAQLLGAAYRHREEIIMEAYEKVKDAEDDHVYYTALHEAHLDAYAAIAEKFYEAVSIEPPNRERKNMGQFWDAISSCEKHLRQRMEEYAIKRASQKN